ncbi:hypothetical protein N800_06970 [Lysobacter daejeonensis GH1-9]|uniref:Uncharacterized protein n=1 Tax=Lysobacter daejeonensis GH1-9 TaxID=1385517 RepID=A0A0A0EU31_9GAMM|nr:hypothetical protein N800_06970 [Lysobacter daejeonensis GH1-9]
MTRSVTFNAQRLGQARIDIGSGKQGAACEEAEQRKTILVTSSLRHHRSQCFHSCRILTSLRIQCLHSLRESGGRIYA